MPLRPLRFLALMAALGSALPAAGQDRNAGAYLAARQAGMSYDFEAASGYFAEALGRDPTNPALLENAMASEIGLGRIDRALPLARTVRDEGIESQLAYMALMADAGQRGDYAALISLLDDGASVGPLIDGLMRAWAHQGEGEMSQALASFDAVIDGQGVSAFGLYHKALSLASVGDFEGADAILSMSPRDGMQQTRRSVVAHAQVLSQLGRNDEALGRIEAAFGADLDPGLADLRARLGAGEAVPFSVITSPRDGLAEAFFSVAGALQGEADAAYALLYARLAQHLSPDHVEATLITAELLEQLERYDLANAAYQNVPSDHPAFFNAELGRADVLAEAGRRDAAVEVLEQLIRTQPDLPIAHATLGDLLRRMERMEGANDAYTRALDLYGAEDPARWFVLYTRAITYHRMEMWPEAEADFRAALQLNPGQPQVLNYLGYSLVERKEHLDEALGMIERAMIRAPDNGAIVDSLGWALYRLGRYDEAILHMERAAELRPVDPVINDHLGDVLWAVGRETEARFHWQRALSFDPTERDAERIRRKLELGLDQVLIDEGEPPLQVANDEG